MTVTARLGSITKTATMMKMVKMGLCTGAKKSKSAAHSTHRTHTQRDPAYEHEGKWHLRSAQRTENKSSTVVIVQCNAIWRARLHYAHKNRTGQGPTATYRPPLWWETSYQILVKMAHGLVMDGDQSEGRMRIFVPDSDPDPRQVDFGTRNYADSHLFATSSISF